MSCLVLCPSLVHLLNYCHIRSVTRLCHWPAEHASHALSCFMLTSIPTRFILPQQPWPASLTPGRVCVLLLYLYLYYYKQGGAGQGLCDGAGRWKSVVWLYDSRCYACLPTWRLARLLRWPADRGESLTFSPCRAASNMHAGRDWGVLHVYHVPALPLHLGTCASQAMYDMLAEYGGKTPPSDQVILDDTKEVSERQAIRSWDCCDQRTCFFHHQPAVYVALSGQ